MIKLHLTSGAAIWVNARHIESVMVEDEGSLVSLIGGEDLTVSDNHWAILEMIKLANG